MIEVQVKTVRSGAWLLGRKGIEPAISDREWYVLVLLGRFPHHPQTWVVPRDHIAAATWVSHMSWLRDPAAPPGTRNTPIENARIKPAVFEHYRDRWELLDQPATSAPVLLPAEMRENISRVGLPPGHPWHQQLPPFADLAQQAGNRAAADR